MGPIHRFMVSWSRHSGWFGERQFPFDAAVECAARSELRRKHADSRSVANLVNVIGHIHDHRAQLDRSAIAQINSLGDRAVDLDIEGKISGVRKAGAQAAAVNSIDAE